MVSGVGGREGRLESHHHRCHYGSQPGRMLVVDEKVPLFKWQTLDWAFQISEELDTIFPNPPLLRGALRL